MNLVTEIREFHFHQYSCHHILINRFSYDEELKLGKGFSNVGKFEFLKVKDVVKKFVLDSKNFWQTFLFCYLLSILVAFA